MRPPKHQRNLQCCAASKIQKAARRFVRSLPVNEFDPILLSKLDRSASFKLVRRNGLVQQYDSFALASYFLHTGIFNDPLTNEGLNTAEVMRLQNHVMATHGEATALLDAYNNPFYKDDERFKEQALEDLDDLCGESLRKMLDLVDDAGCRPGDFICEAEEILYPEFDNVLRQIMSQDEKFGMQCVLKYVTLAKGDPRHLRPAGNRKWHYTMDFLFAKILHLL